MLPWDPFRLYCFRAFGRKTFEILFVMVVPWQHLDGSWFALYIHRPRNIKFSFRMHILYNKINLLFVPKVPPLRTKFQKSSCRRHENSIVGMIVVTVPSARNVSFNSQYNFKVIILFYLFRVGCDKDVQLPKQANGLSSSHFRFRFQSVYKNQPCSLHSQLGTTISFK
jgi:hypothetical protein